MTRPPEEATSAESMAGYTLAAPRLLGLSDVKMSLDDLRARQESAAAWKELSKERKEEFQAALQLIEAGTKAAAGIELESQVTSVSFHPGEDQYQVYGRALHFKVPGISAEIIVSCIVCYVTRVKDGPWQMRCQDWSTEGVNEFDTLAPRPWVPLRIASGEHAPIWSHSLWWRGPQDNDKVVSAILDGFSRKERPSELGPSKANGAIKNQSGCVLTLLLISSILALGSVLLT